MSAAAELTKKMTTLADTMSVGINSNPPFNNFDNQEDDKDSDEESFHLPIEDDDDKFNDDSMEKEDDILEGPDNAENNDVEIDQALEDTLLEEPEDATNKIDQENSETENTDIEITEAYVQMIQFISKTTEEGLLTEPSTSEPISKPSTSEGKSPTPNEETETDSVDKRVAENKKGAGADLDECELSNDSSQPSQLDDLLNITIIRGIEEDDENARRAFTKQAMLEADEESLDKGSDVDFDMESDNEDDITVMENDANMAEDDDLSDNGKEKEHEDSGKENENPDEDGTSSDGSLTSGKRSLDSSQDGVAAAKKIKLSQMKKIDSAGSAAPVAEPPKVLTSLQTFMQRKKGKFTMAHLEQFCLQKIGEKVMHRSELGEVHQSVRSQEIIIEQLRREVTQLMKQSHDLEIVNRRLVTELKLQSGTNKALVPLKITRSVGLQVRVPPTSPEPVPASKKRKNCATPSSSPPAPKQPSPAPAKKTNGQAGRSPKPTTANPPPPVYKAQLTMVANAPTKPTKPSNLLSQALQTWKPVFKATTTPSPQKRTSFPPIRPKVDPVRASIIDLTDEDDRAAKAKVVTKNVPLSQMKTVTVSQNKTINVGGNKTITVNQTKTIPLMQQKAGTPSRAVPASVARLTPTQIKNGSITLPAGVVSSSSPQVMYVMQPTSTLSGGLVTSTTGAQKAVIVNFQATTNGVLASSLNGTQASLLNRTTGYKSVLRKHPAPLPPPPIVPISMDTAVKPVPPKPHLTIRKTDNGIILQWRMPYPLENFETIASYQLYAYQETPAPPSTTMWRRVGDVKALALPMACTLTQFADKNKYYFAVRSVDIHKRIGAFSDPEEISL